MNYMPPQSKSNQDEVFLWDHEWAGSKKRDAHGHDYGHYRLKAFPEEYKNLSKAEVNKKIQKQYYN